MVCGLHSINLTSDNVVETEFVSGGSYAVGTVLRVYGASYSFMNWGFNNSDALTYFSVPYNYNIVPGSTDLYSNGSDIIEGEIYCLAHDGYVDYYIGEFTMTSTTGHVYSSVKDGDTFSLYHIGGQLGVSGYKIITINE